MRKTPTTPEKAIKSANARLKANQAALLVAHQKDVVAGPAGQQRNQVRAATEWLRSEMTAVPDADRQQILAHVIELCQNANTRARLTVMPAYPSS